MKNVSEQAELKASPGLTLTLICLFSSKDFFLILMDLLPRKFRGAANDYKFTEQANFELALAAIVPIGILFGLGKIGYRSLYQKTQSIQLSALGAVIVIHIIRSIQSILGAPYQDHSFNIAATVAFVYFLILIIIQRNKLYRTQYVEFT